MEIKSLRELQKEKMLRKYKKIVIDIQNGMSWYFLAQKYGYKNAASIRAAYYQYIVVQVA